PTRPHRRKERNHAPASPTLILGTTNRCGRPLRDARRHARLPHSLGAPRRARSVLNTHLGYSRLGLSGREERPMSETVSYTVPGMHCGHCEHAVTEELESVQGVESVDVDLDTKVVTVIGRSLDDATLRAAIDEAGYEAA